MLEQDGRGGGGWERVLEKEEEVGWGSRCAPARAGAGCWHGCGMCWCGQAGGGGDADPKGAGSCRTLPQGSPAPVPCTPTQPLYGPSISQRPQPCPNCGHAICGGSPSDDPNAPPPPQAHSRQRPPSLFQTRVQREGTSCSQVLQQLFSPGGGPRAQPPWTIPPSSSPFFAQ